MVLHSIKQKPTNTIQKIRNKHPKKPGVRNNTKNTQNLTPDKNGCKTENIDGYKAENSTKNSHRILSPLPLLLGSIKFLSP